MAELEPNPCETCEVRKGYAKAFDMHIWGDDCPHVCETFGEWNREEATP